MSCNTINVLGSIKKKKKKLKYCKYTVLLSAVNSNDVQLKTSTALTGAAFGGTKPSISFLVIRPSGPEPGEKK